MREVKIATDADIQSKLEMLARAGTAGPAAARWLCQLIAAGALTVRSADIYATALLSLARQAEGRSIEAMLQPDTFEAWLRALCQGTAKNEAKRKPKRPRPGTYSEARRAAEIVRRFCIATNRTYPESVATRVLAEPSPAPSRPQPHDPPAPARGPLLRIDDDTPAGRARNLAILTDVDEEARRVLATTAGRIASGEAGGPELLRAATIAMCRYAGATPADLVATTWEDLVCDASDPTQYVGWFVVRTNRTRQGAGKTEICRLALPAEARGFLSAWITYRGTIPLPPPATGTKTTADTRHFVFVEPDKATELERPIIWHIVAGMKGKYHVRNHGEPPRAEQHHLALTGPANAPKPDPIRLSPALLRHTLVLDLARSCTDQPELPFLLEYRMGLRSRSYWRYLRLLHREPTPRTGTPRPPADAAMRRFA